MPTAASSASPRIIGAPAPGAVGCDNDPGTEAPPCDGYFTSIGELAVFYDTAREQAPDPDPDPDPGPGAGGGPTGGTAAREPVVRIARRALRVDRNRRTAVRVRCPRSTATRCSGIVTVMTKNRLVARRTFSVAPDNYRTVNFRVRRPAFRYLKSREGGRMRVNVHLLTRAADMVLRRDEARLTLRRTK